MGTSRRKLCSVCLESFAEKEVSLQDGYLVCYRCAARGASPRIATPLGGVRAVAAAAAQSPAGEQTPRGEKVVGEDSGSDRQRLALPFGRELFKCLVDGDFERYQRLFLAEADVAVCFPPGESMDRLAIARSRMERDFKSRRATFFKDEPFELVAFQLGPAEIFDRDHQVYGRSNLVIRADGIEKKIPVRHVYRVFGRFKLEVFE